MNAATMSLNYTRAYPYIGSTFTSETSPNTLKTYII